MIFNIRDIFIKKFGGLLMNGVRYKYSCLTK